MNRSPSDIDASDPFSRPIDSPPLQPLRQLYDGIVNYDEDPLELHSEVFAPVGEDLCYSSTTMLTENKIVMVEERRRNIFVLEFRPKYLKIKGMFNFKEQPAYVASVRQNEFVVTFPKRHAVRFVKFVEKRFDVNEAIDVHGECAGIRMLGETGNMLIAYPVFRELKILTSTGKVLNTISTLSLGLTFRPLSLAVFEELIFLVDRSTNCVLKCLLFDKKVQVMDVTYLKNCSKEMLTHIIVSSNGVLYETDSFDGMIYQLGKLWRLRSSMSQSTTFIGQMVSAQYVENLQFLSTC